MASLIPSLSPLKVPVVFMIIKKYSINIYWKTVSSNHQCLNPTRTPEMLDLQY